MENISIWKKITLGFWIGIGFLIPQFLLMFGGTALVSMLLPSMMEESIEAYSEDLGDEVWNSASTVFSDMDMTAVIELGSYTETRSGGHLHITGSVKNTGEKSVGSVEVQAELLDAEGNFVYECSEYISHSVAAGATENFLLKCGCSRETIPEYSKVELRVVGASPY